MRSMAEALALFDELDPVTPEELIGSWRGEGFATGHPLDGLLEAWHWQGKRFES
ncbi:MAG: GXWXG domain-containing protein, partial [Cyanobacteriota bacterium]|nr:GXWXG domain-containing protein [Cyanobacteriota bacterium]